jgi:hypothetical protein
MTFQEGLKQVEKATHKIVEANNMITEATMDAFLFTWKWWIALAMLIIPWVVWAIFRKKESSARLMFAAFFVMIFSSTLDSIGVDNGNWYYPLKVIPLPTISYSYRYSLLPVIIMFLIQIKPNFNPFIKAVLFGAVSAFVGMPILTALDMYRKIDWAPLILF